MACSFVRKFRVRILTLIDEIWDICACLRDVLCEIVESSHHRLWLLAALDFIKCRSEIENNKSGLVLLIDGIFETGAYGVPSKSQNPTILGQGGPSSTQCSNPSWACHLHHPLPKWLKGGAEGLKIENIKNLV